MPKLISRDDIVSDEDLPITAPTPTPQIPETPIGGSGSTANDFFNTNTNFMPFKYITTVKLSPADATQWTTQEKLYFNALTSIGVNLFDELNNDYGDLQEDKDKYRATNGSYGAGYKLGNNWFNYLKLNSGFKGGTFFDGTINNNILNNIKTFVESKGTTLSAFLQNAMQRNGIALPPQSTPTPNTPSTPNRNDAPTPTPPAANPLNPPVATKPELQQKLIAIANSFDNNKWHMAAYMKQFVNNDDNLQPMKDAVATLGYPLFDNGRGWLWETQDFICLARYFKDYPIPTDKNTTCSSCSTIIQALSAEDAAIVNETTLGGNANEAQSKQKALNKVKTLYNAWYAKNDCDKKLVDQQAEKQQEIQEKQSEQSNQQVLDALKIAGENVSKTSNITTYAIYGFGGLILLSGVIYLFRK